MPRLGRGRPEGGELRVLEVRRDVRERLGRDVDPAFEQPAEPGGGRLHEVDLAGAHVESLGDVVRGAGLVLVDPLHDLLALDDLRHDRVGGDPRAAQEGDDHAALPTQPLRCHHRFRPAAVDAQRPLHEVRADRLARGAGDDERVPRVARVVDRRRDQVADPDRRDRQREQAEEELWDRRRDALAWHGGTIAPAGSGAVQARFRTPRPRRSPAGRGP